MSHTGAHPYSMGEEIAHTLSHGLALVAAIVMTVFLISAASQLGSDTALVAIGIYSVSLIFLYACSTLYHGAYGSRFQQFYKLLDHSAIFMKIAGSYTPFTLLVLPAEKGIPLLVFVWALAAVGIVLKATGFAVGLRRGVRPKAFSALSLAIYLGMGWSGALLLGDIAAMIPNAGVYWLVAGGLAYTVGAVFYAMKSLPYGHFVWHLFVVAGSACHFVTIYLYVI